MKEGVENEEVIDTIMKQERNKIEAQKTEVDFVDSDWWPEAE